MPFLTPNTVPENDFVCRVVRIPNDPLFVYAVSGALLELTKVWNWEPFGEMSPAEMAAASVLLVEDYLASNACMIGAIFPYATAEPPPNALPCDGAVYNRVDYPRLYAALESVFILDADTFTIPDLNNRFVFGSGGDYSPGSTGGESTHTLTADEMPIHEHVDAGHLHSTSGTVTLLGVVPGEVPLLAPSPFPELTTTSQASIGSAGAGQPHNNLPPYMALPFCIVAK